MRIPNHSAACWPIRRVMDSYIRKKVLLRPARLLTPLEIVLSNWRSWIQFGLVAIYFFLITASRERLQKVASAVWINVSPAGEQKYLTQFWAFIWARVMCQILQTWSCIGQIWLSVSAGLSTTWLVNGQFGGVSIRRGKLSDITCCVVIPLLNYRGDREFAIGI